MTHAGTRVTNSDDRGSHEQSISRVSTDFFIAAALLALFGAAALNNAGLHDAQQVTLAVLMGAGLYESYQPPAPLHPATEHLSYPPAHQRLLDDPA
jgi:hypothetical protein